MKKFYVFTTVFMFIASLTTAQTTYYWVGGDGLGNLWDDAANWSLTSGGAGGAGIPTATSTVIFDQNSRARVNQQITQVGAIHVIGNSNTTIYTDFSAFEVQINLSATTGYALFIEDGATLKDSAAIDVLDGFFITNFLPNTNALVDGTWIFDGLPEVPVADVPISTASLQFPASAGYSNRLDVNGTIKYTRNSVVYNLPFMDSYIFFNDGSTLWMDTNGSNVLTADYHENSTIYITGNVNAGSSHEAGIIKFGNFIYESADQAQSIQLGWQQVTFWGDVEIRNTNGHPLILCGSVGGSGTRLQTIRGDLTVTGNSRAFVTHRSGTAQVILDIYGDLNAGGTEFNVDSKSDGISNGGYTLLRLRSNLNHTTGIFRMTSTAVDVAADRTIMEMNGSAAQYITSVGANWEGNNNTFVLRINNANGVYLNSPVTVGRLNFETANKGVVYTTAANVLTIANRSRAPGHRTLIAPGENAFVDGPVRRRVSSVNPFPFPTGKNGVYRPIIIQTNSAIDGMHQAEFMAGPHPDPSVLHPILGLETGYWQVQNITGDNEGSVGLELKGSIAGAQVQHGLVAAKYNGSDWERAGGPMIVPGNASTGIVESAIMTPLTGFYAIAYGNQSALPVILVDLNARKLNNTTALINWQITAESTADKFEVLKSANGRDFETVGETAGVFRKENYQMLDNKLSAGTSYYRLKMYDVDGTVTLSKIVAVINGLDGVMITSMMPTVVTSQARLNVSSSQKLTMSLVVTDLYGRTIHRQIAGINAGNQDVLLNLQHLSAGTYHITGYYNGQKTASIRFIKQ